MNYWVLSRGSKYSYAYNEANKERDKKRAQEHKKQWEESLQSDNDMFALDHLSDDELKEYFNQEKDNQ